MTKEKKPTGPKDRKQTNKKKVKCKEKENWLSKRVAQNQQLKKVKG